MCKTGRLHGLAVAPSFLQCFSSCCLCAVRLRRCWKTPSFLAVSNIILMDLLFSIFWICWVCVACWVPSLLDTAYSGRSFRLSVVCLALFLSETWEVGKGKSEGDQNHNKVGSARANGVMARAQGEQEDQISKFRSKLQINKIMKRRAVQDTEYFA